MSRGSARPWSRRDLIVRSMALTVGLGFGLAPVACRRVPEPERVRRLLSLVPGEEGHAVGVAYLRRVGPAEASRLARELVREAPDEVLAKGDRALGAWIADRVHRDFEQGRVITVDQWQLSRTEVALGVLKALETKPPPRRTAERP